MVDEFEFTLHSPLTKEDWNKILDAEHENIMYVTFQTPQGRQVRYIKYEVFDKIKADIKSMDFDFGDYYDHTDEIIEMVYKALDKYKYKAENKVEDK